jgi:O-antigen ligase
MGTMVWENQGVIRLHGSTPIYNHPNSFAGMALGCLPFILYFYRFIPGYLQAVLLVQFVLMLNIIVFTGSRTGYIGCMIMLVFLIWKSKNRRRALLAVLPLVVALAYLVPQQYIERAETLTVEKEGEGGSVDARLQILRDAWQVFLDNPLGVGVQAFPAVRKSRFGRQQDTHNLYLEVATNLGIQGLIIFLGFITALLRVLTRLVSSINRQINQLEKEIAGIRHGNQGGKQMGRHLLDLRIMLATGKAVYLFLIIRLSLGIFGHDLYEIYWWFALGTTVAVWNLNTIARSRTEMLCCSDNSEGRIFTPALRTGKMSKQAWKRFLVKKLPGQHEKDGNDARKRDDPAK